MFKKILIPVVASALLLVGCEGEKTKEPSDSDIHGKEKLVWFEMVNNGDRDSVYYDISYLDNGAQKEERVDSSYIVEHILDNPDTQPYVEVNKGSYHIYRQPMNIMYDKGVSGKVKSKEVVGSER